METTQWLAQGQVYVVGFASLVTALTVIVGAVLGIYAFFKKRSEKPHESIQDELNRHSSRLDKHDEYFGRDNENIRDMQTEMREMRNVNRLLVRGMMQLITHELDGNHVDMLTAVRDDMNDYLINR